MKNKILVLATHPDDETLCCGGMILKHLESCDEVVWMIATTARDLNGIDQKKLKECELDHRKLFQSAHSCAKSFRYPFIKKILMMETLSETEFGAALPGQGFSPNVFIDISNYLEKKIEIMKMYHGEMGEHRFPRSEENMRALATLRGAISGVKYAESFMLLKEIV